MHRPEKNLQHGSSETRSRRGFTLVEVLVSMLLLSIFMASVLGLVTMVTRGTVVVRDRTEATSLGWSRLERARAMEFDQLDQLTETAPGTVVDEMGRSDQEGRFRRKTTVTEVASDGLPARRVRVEVWTRTPGVGTFEGEPEVLETMITDVPLAGSES